MKYILGFFHSIYFSYICWFGGKIEGGTWYLLWKIPVRASAPVTIANINLIPLRREWVFLFRMYYSEKSKFQDLKWEVKEDNK